MNQSVWKMLYGVSDTQMADAAWLARDDDADGMSNGAELAAGTSPFQSGSVLSVTSMTADATTVTVSFQTAPGKLYALQRTTTLGDAAAWAALSPAVQMTGDGLLHSLSAPKSGTSAFYRILVQDQDSDGDGVSDWAERVAGFDAADAHTHGSSADDHTAIMDALAAENVVTVSATKPIATQPVDAATEATDTGTITVTRGGSLHFSSITVPLEWKGTAVSGTDYEQMPSLVTFPAKTGVVTLTLVPRANTSRQSPATATAVARIGNGYRLGAASSASVQISPSGNPTGTGLTGAYYTSTSTQIGKAYDAAALFAPANLKGTRLDATVDFTYASGVAPIAAFGTTSTYYTIRWLGQVQPQYSELYYFYVRANDGVKLWVDGKLIIDSWASTPADRYGTIALQAGLLYDLKLEYYQASSTAETHLSWFSDSQPKQVIPTARLRPSGTGAIPPAITSAPTALGFVQQPFAFTVTSSAVSGTTRIALDPDGGSLPPGLTLNETSGQITGTPTTAGTWQVALKATNTVVVGTTTTTATGAGVLQIQILNPGSGVTREIWTGVSSTRVADLPLLTRTPTSIDHVLTKPADNVTSGTNVGERLRGYFIPPATGNYYFWLAASNEAELWLSNDGEVVNLTRRAWVGAPGTAEEEWNNSAQTGQKSPWLSLVAGQPYYYEVRHNTGSAGGSSHVAMGWMASGSTTTTVVPEFLVTRYEYPATTSGLGALYVTNLSPQGAASSNAAGSADLRMSADGSQAILHFNYGGLTSPRTAYHIHAAADSTGSGPIVFDLDDVDKFHPELKTADGGYVWNIVAAGALSAAQIVTAVQQGYAYFNVHTVNFPNGEIRGNLRLVQGSQNAPVPVADPGYSSSTVTDAEAARFLNQTAYGASPGDLASVKAGGYSAWLDAQFTLPVTHLLDDVQTHVALDPDNMRDATLLRNAWWRAAVTANDQMRQRTAFALSQILVISSSNATLDDHAEGLSSYYDTLADNAFGNFRNLLKAVTLHPSMGYFLNMQGNKLGNLTTGLHPNENYAREIMQLFSIGLNRLWPDGTLVLDSRGNLVPTYNQDDISGMARVFTGWNWSQSLQGTGRLPTSFSPTASYINPMVLVPAYHELGTKAVLDNVVLPAAIGYNYPQAVTPGSEADPSTVAFDNYGLADLEKAIDNIFYHPNVGPYICRQLIQRLVASNPSPAYVHRVVLKFNDDGSAQHLRGNMQAVLRTILLDGEARSLSAAPLATSGKQREPLLRIAAPARTFPFVGNSGTYAQNGGIILTLTTTTPHRLSGGDAVTLDFTGNATGSPAVAPWDNPTSVGSYTVLSTPAPTSTTFAVTPTGLSSGAYAYTQKAGSSVLNFVTTTPGAGAKAYLKFLTGGAPDGVYTIDSVDTTSSNVTVGDTVARSGTVVRPKLSGGYAITNPGSPSTVTVIGYVNHNLKVNDHVWLATPTGAKVAAGEYTVATVVDENRFTIANTTVFAADTENTITIYPLVAPPLTRSGNFKVASSKFDMGSTDSTLAQTPMDAPTVFNFYYPDFQFPGTLSAANVTTPEFQLTTDTNIINLTNTVYSTILSSANTNGLSTFSGGAILLDLGAYMGTPWSVADRTGVAALVDKLSDLLTGGVMKQAAKDVISDYVSNTTYFPLTSSTYVRDRVRAIAQMILISPEYAIQR